MNEEGKHLSEEDVGGAVHGLDGRGTDRHLQQESHFAHHPLHGAVVVEDVDQEAEEVDDAQRLSFK
jgi:hypothetical protein